MPHLANMKLLLYFGNLLLLLAFAIMAFSSSECLLHIATSRHTFALALPSILWLSASVLLLSFIKLDLCYFDHLACIFPHLAFS